MIYSNLLDLENLENREYIHGTATVRGVTNELVKAFGGIDSFSIRLLKPLKNLPTLYVGEEYTEGKPNAKGTFRSNGRTLSFYLLDSNTPCTRFKVIDDSLFKTSKTRGNYVEVKLAANDNVFEAWHSILKSQVATMFEEQGLTDPMKQLWFVGAEFTDLNYLLEAPIRSIGYSTAYKMLSTYCIQRDMFFNGRLIGNRTAIYA